MKLETTELDRSMYTPLHKISPVLLPLASGSFAYSLLMNYTLPKSKYLRAFGFTVAAGYGGWSSLKAKAREYDVFLMKNYKHFGEEMREALASGDARYLADYHRGPRK